MKLLSLFGLDRRVRRVRIAAGEGALAVEDRAQLLKMAWDDEKHRVTRLLGLGLVVVGLTTVMVALLSVAVVVQFWDTAHRSTAAWSVAIFWLVLWLAVVIAIVQTVRGPSDGIDAARREFGRDWYWLRGRLGARHESKDQTSPPAPPPTREELLARIERQRERIATLETPPPSDLPHPKHVPADETPTQTAIRLASTHPIAAGAVAAGVVAVVGPSRLLKVATWLLPVLWRMRQ